MGVVSGSSGAGYNIGPATASRAKRSARNRSRFSLDCLQGLVAIADRLPSDARLDKNSLPKIKLPNRDGFVSEREFRNITKFKSDRPPIVGPGNLIPAFRHARFDQPGGLIVTATAALENQCPLFLLKQTWIGAPGMSEKCRLC
jgi:hypothetical protein